MAFIIGHSHLMEINRVSSFGSVLTLIMKKQTEVPELEYDNSSIRLSSANRTLWHAHHCPSLGLVPSVLLLTSVIISRLTLFKCIMLRLFNVQLRACFEECFCGHGNVLHWSNDAHIKPI